MNEWNKQHLCDKCGSMPCDWVEFAKDIQQKAYTTFYNNKKGKKKDKRGQNVPNEHMRKILYQHYCFLRHGVLGKGIRIPVPPCVGDESKNMYPSESGKYMGYKNH